MPNAVSSGATSGYIDMSGAPGADNSLDDLFPNPELQPAVPPQAAQGTTPQQTPQAPAAPFLKAGDSVYNTAEEAARGLEHKDQLVARYRAFLAENGFDPNELKPVQKEPPQATPEQSQFTYLGNPKKYYEDLARAANPQRPDPEAYERVQRQYQQEVFSNFLAPYAPLMAETARQRAIRQVSADIPNFQTFIEGPGFKKTVETIPLYKEMLELGESNPDASKRLPEVYRMIYLTYQGMNQAQPPTAQSVPPVQTSPTVRQQPTLAPSAMTPPTPGIPTTNWATDRDARRQLIKDREAQGIKDLDWGSLGT